MNTVQSCTTVQSSPGLRYLSDAFCVFVATFTARYLPWYCENFVIEQLVFRDSMMKQVFLSQNIVGAEYIVCTHWLNIVGAAALTTPMVATPMAISSGNAFNFAFSATATPQRFCSWKPLSLLRYRPESPQVAE